jgi:poly(3-hydroxybutyrate) depolymerase
VAEAIGRAGKNQPELEKAISAVQGEQREAMEFLIANMPDRDLTSLSSDFLVENVRLAFDARDTAPWKDSIPNDIFLNNVLPYANINEGRDPWRQEFKTRFMPLIAGAKTTSQAAAMLNQKLFPLVKVKYSTQRAKADQNPTESIKSGLASCTGLSILLIDACRAVGIPARFVGTPLWSDKSGNHSWVEVWDNGWHFTGAAEPNGDELDKAWFTDRASKADRDHELNAIYAVSFQRTPLRFPLVWDRSIDYIRAVNVTDRYTQRAVKQPEGTSLLMVRVIDPTTRQRVATKLSIRDANGKELFTGQSKDERFDANDHIQMYLPTGVNCVIEATDGTRSILRSVPVGSDDQTITLELPKTVAMVPAKSRLVATTVARPSLSKAEAESEVNRLWNEHVASIRESRAPEMTAKEITLQNLKMPFTYELFGDKPSTGRSLYISMHGGGGAPARVNTQQWENQKKLYKLQEGVYLVPRAPTDTWNLWHQDHIDLFFDRLIENMIVFEDVDPNKVYIMGYSAGGDGVYQLAPRLADRLAAAAMMAGHPNETSPLGLRNLPFTLHMGANDSAYNRNKIAGEWAVKLDDLQKEDPKGYQHFVKLHEGKGHWMDRQDAEALPWMAKFERITNPEKIVWKQDDAVRNRFYWLAVEPADVRERALVIATHEGQKFDIQSSDVDRITIRLNDAMIDFEQPIQIASGERMLFEGKVERSLECIQKTLAERGDRQAVYSAEVTVSLK